MKFRHEKFFNHSKSSKKSLVTYKIIQKLHVLLTRVIGVFLNTGLFLLFEAFDILLVYLHNCWMILYEMWTQCVHSVQIFMCQNSNLHLTYAAKFPDFHQYPNKISNIQISKYNPNKIKISKKN